MRFLASHFGVLAAERKIDFIVEAAEECLAAVDPDKLQRVLMNLLANAFKFVPDGGSVRCTVRQSSHELTVAVDDSGPGVKPELRTAIFERFRQGDGGTNRKAGGTGLGLAIAKEFIELHKGRIEVLSDLRLIAITGYGQESDHRKTREAGFHHHLVKPVDVAAIEAAVTICT